MNHDDIIHMAREAGFDCAPDGRIYVDCFSGACDEELERFAALVAALVAATEREACAKLAESTICDTHLPTGVRIYGTRAAAAIRARRST